jgi:nicotinamidase-related amidase
VLEARGTRRHHGRAAGQKKFREEANLGITYATTLFAAMAALAAESALAGDITAGWASVTPPPAPELKSVTVDPKTTALLVLDFGKNNCGVRPRCLANVPNVKKLIDEARAHNMMLAYTLPGQDRTGLVDQSLAPRPGEFLIQGSGGADKFIRSNLDQGLKDKGIKTVIVTGTSAQGAVAGTTNGAAQRGYTAVVPVDGMSSESAFNELYAAWHIAKGGPAKASDRILSPRPSHQQGLSVAAEGYGDRRPCERAPDCCSVSQDARDCQRSAAQHMQVSLRGAAMRVTPYLWATDASVRAAAGHSGVRLGPERPLT